MFPFELLALYHEINVNNITMIANNPLLYTLGMCTIFAELKLRMLVSTNYNIARVRILFLASSLLVC